MRKSLEAKNHRIGKTRKNYSET